MMKKISAISLLSLIFIFHSCEQILLEQDISASPVVLLAPADSTVVKESNISFRWGKINGASHYNIQVAKPNFESPQQIVIDKMVEENFFETILPPNNYEWRVRAFNSGYTTGFASANIEVKDIEDFSSRQVILLTPGEDFITNEPEVHLIWRKVEDADVYRVMIEEEGSVISEITTTENNLDVEFPHGEFTWRVRAENETKNTFYSERNILVDTVIPTIPELKKPLDEEIFYTGDISFTWERDIEEGSEEIDSIYIFKDEEAQDLAEKDTGNFSYSTTLEEKQTYYWYVQSFDEAGNKSEPSAIRSFTVR